MWSLRTQKALAVADVHGNPRQLVFETEDDQRWAENERFVV